MILVDDAGGAFPCINHSPWFGVTLADFVMPFFLFVVGVSTSLVFKVKRLLNWCLASFLLFYSFVVVLYTSLQFFFESSYFISLSRKKFVSPSRKYLANQWPQRKSY